MPCQTAYARLHIVKSFSNSIAWCRSYIITGDLKGLAVHIEAQLIQPFILTAKCNWFSRLCNRNKANGEHLYGVSSHPTSIRFHSTDTEKQNKTICMNRFTDTGMSEPLILYQNTIKNILPIFNSYWCSPMPLH